MADRAKVVVVYEDGTTEEFNPNKPKFLLAMERKFNVQVPERHEHINWLAWFALGKPEGDMDKWLDSVEAIEQHAAKTGDEGGDDSGEADPS